MTKRKSEWDEPIGTLRWFGHPYDAPAWETMPPWDQDPTGRVCVLCSRAIGSDDDGVAIPAGDSGVRRPVHLRCFLKNLGIEQMPKRIDV